MHVLVLGATGKTGVYVYKYALEQGCHVTILVRDASKVEPQSGLTVVQGSPMSDDDMKRAFSATGEPVDAVIQTLNSRRASENPWAKWLGPPRLMADATALAAKHLRQQSPPPARKPRLVVMNAQGIAVSWSVTPYLVRFLIRYSNIGKSYEDHEMVSDEVEGNCGSLVTWTLALAVPLADAGVKEVKTFAPTQRGASMFVTRESVGRWMVDVAMSRKGSQFDNVRVITSN